MSTEEQTKISVEVSRCEQLLTELVRIKSVVGESTTAHQWVSARLRELGMTVEHYAVEGRKTPLVLGVLEGDGDGPGVLFDAHYDTVHAVPGDWSHDPWGADVEDGVLYGRGAVDSKGTHVAMLAALEQVVASGQSRSGPIIFMSDSDGEDGFRGATLMADLERHAARRHDLLGRGHEQHRHRDRLPRHLDLEGHGRRAHRASDRARERHQRRHEDGEARGGGRRRSARDAARHVDVVRAARDRPGDPHAPRRRLDDPRALRRRRLRHVARRHHAQRGARVDRGLPAQLEQEDGEVRYEFKVLPMGAGRLWLRPGESDPEAPGVKALEQAVADVRGEPGEVRKFNGGWVDAVELMRPGDERLRHPGRDHLRSRRLRAGPRGRRAHRARRRRRGRGDLRRGHAYAPAVSADEAHFIARPVSISRAYEQLAGQIRERILAGELAEGDRLPSELTLAREAQVSRGTVREALRLLEESGFVERTSPRILVVRRPRGEEPALREATRALKQSDVTFDDVHEALLALDPDADAAGDREGRASADLERLERHLEEQARVLSQPETWSRLDDEFHLMIAEIAGNVPLLLARRPLSAILLPTMWRFVRDERMTRAAFTFHERIVEQMRARDPEAAAFMTSKHINDFRRAWVHAGLDVDLPIGGLD